MKLIYFLGLLMLFMVSVANTQNSIKVLNSQYNKSKNQLKVKEHEKRNVLSSLFKINREIKLQARKKQKITQSIFSQKVQVDLKNTKIKQLKQKINERKKFIDRRLLSIYSTSLEGTSYSFLFDTQSAIESEKNLLILQKLSESDKQIISEYEEDLQELKNVKESLLKSVKSLILNQKKLETYNNKLTSELVKKNSILTQIRQKKNYYISFMKRLRDKAKNIEVSDQISNAIKSIDVSFYEQKGKLLKPIKQAKILSYFGIYKNDFYNFSLMNKGIFLKSTSKQVVTSVHSGEIEFSDVLKGYGKVVIINHNDDFYTVYSGIDTQIQPGTLVKKGDVIGETLVSKKYQTHGLYFEIRHFSEALNPLGWFDKNQNILAEGNRDVQIF